MRFPVTSWYTALYAKYVTALLTVLADQARLVPTDTFWTAFVT